MKWLRVFGDVLMGTGIITYYNRRDWFTRCVLVRLAFAAFCAVLGITVAFAFGNALGEYGISRSLMAHAIILIMTVLTVLLAFGSGRNYGRLTARDTRTHARSFPQHTPNEMGNEDILAELTALNPHFAEDKYRWSRWRDLLTTLATRSNLRVWQDKPWESRG